MKDYIEFYEVISGSKAYGFANENSDTDIRSIAFPSYKKFFGMGNFEYAETKDPDKQIYSLKKFVTLALNANPNIIELLFIDKQDFILKESEFSKKLKSLRENFITKKIFKSYMGYANAQIHKLKNAGNCSPKIGSRRFEGIQKCGYDTKAATHVIRLLSQGIELAKKRKISMPLSEPDVTICKKIRLGLLTLQEVIEFADKLMQVFKNLEETSKLLATPNYELINNFVIASHREFYVNYFARVKEFYEKEEK